MAAERYLLKIGGDIEICELQEGNLVTLHTISPPQLTFGPDSPSLRAGGSTIVFDGYTSSDRGHWILEAPLGTYPVQDVRKIAIGFNPSVSPDGNLLVYSLINEKEYFLYDFRTGEAVSLEKGIEPRRPVVWLDNERLLYRLDVDLTEENRVSLPDLVLKNLRTGNREIWASGGFDPSQKFPEKQQVLGGNFFGDKISLLDVQSRKMRELVSSRIFSIGSRPVLRAGNAGFLYSRQNWTNWLHLLPEAQSIYARSWDGEEVLIKEVSSLGGGTAIPSE